MPVLRGAVAAPAVPWWLWAAAAIVLVMLVGAAAPLLGGGDQPASPPPGLSQDGPTLEELQAENGACVPAGCELWRVELGYPGAARVAGDLVIHTEQLARVQVDDGTREPVAQERRITVIDRMNGAVRWEQELATFARHLGQVGLAVPVGGDGLLVPTAGGVTLLDATDGRVRWQGGVEVTDLYRSQWGRDGLLVWGSRVDDDHRDGWLELVALLGADDGRTIWQVDDATLVGEAGELILLQHRADGLVARDRATGEVRWSRPDADASGSLWPVISDRHLLVREDGAMRVLDVSDGEPVTEVAVGRDQQVVALVGDLAVAADPQVAFGLDGGDARGDAVLLDVADPHAQPVWLEAVVGLVELRPIDPATWWSGEPERPRGLVIAQQPDDQTLRLSAYDADGAPRWQEERTLDDPASCCWGHQGRQRPGTLPAAPTGAGGEPRR